MFTAASLAMFDLAEIASVLNHAYLTICRLEQKLVAAGVPLHDPAKYLTTSQVDAILTAYDKRKAQFKRPEQGRYVPFIPINQEHPHWVAA